jgi:hypothetical protein
MSKVISISVSDDNYEYLQKKAQQEETSIANYIKLQVLPRKEYDDAYNKMIELINTLEDGTEFSLRELFGPMWKNISKGTKLSLGRIFYNHVVKEKIQNVKALNSTDSQKSQLYIKMEEY